LTPQHRTRTNELIEFLENPLPGQIIVYFGLSYRGKSCGIATLMIYPNSGVALIDHMALAPTERGAGAFFAFCNLIAEYLEEKSIAFNYLLVEIMLSEQPVTTGLNALALIRLTKFIGFKVANIPYYAPDETIGSDHDGCRAALAVYAQPEKSEIDAAEFVRILEVVFFDHYIAWHRKTMNPEEFERYYAAALKEFDQIKSFIQRQGSVKINGMKNFDLPYVLQSQSDNEIGILGILILVAIPASLTIVFSLMQAVWLTIAVVVASCLVFALLLVPALRRPILRFFQQEQ
jgi:hypothetical protein